MRKLPFILALLFATIAGAGYWQNAPSLVLNPYTGHEVIRGLVGWWKFDEGSGSTAYDASGQGNDGTLQNMEEGDWVTGLNGSGYALDFDGSNEYVTFPDTALPSGSSARTIMLCIQLDSNANAYYRIFGYGTNSTGQHFALYWKKSDTTLVIGLNGSGRSVVHAYDNNPHHIAVRYPDGETLSTKVEIFVDGSKPTHTNIGSGTVNTTKNGTFYVANDVNNNLLLDGKTDAVHVYNKALTDAEISAKADCQ